MIHTNNKEKLYFEIKRDKGNLFYFSLKDKDDNIYLESGSYTQKTNCQNGITSVRRNYINEDCFKVEQVSNEKWRGILKTKNGHIIATTPYFDTEIETIKLIKVLKSSSLDENINNIIKVGEIHFKAEYNTYKPSTNKSFIKYHLNANGEYKYIFSSFAEAFNQDPNFYKRFKIFMKIYESGPFNIDKN